MTGSERTHLFLRGESVDRPPFHPIIMRWAAKYAGVSYRDFCTVPEAKCMAMIRCANDFDIDWVTVMSDPWAEASAFGIQIEYPEDNLPLDVGGHQADASTASRLKKYDPSKNIRCLNRLAEIIEFRRRTGNEKFIVGWVEGPVAEYVDIRRATNASVDLLLFPEAVSKTMDVITDCALEFLTLQIRAGADCIGIGDAFCSQIGPELYFKFAFDRQKILVDQIHSEGAIAKLHICGETSSILEGMIKTGADIIDIDHQVQSLKPFTPLLDKHQYFSGKADPVTIIQNGSAEQIIRAVTGDFTDSDGRCIVSAGCEITPGTTIENMVVFSKSAELQEINR